LRAGGIDNPQNTSLVLLSNTLSQPKSWALAHGDYEPLPSEIQTIDVITGKLLQGVPLPYILERWEFLGRIFSVTHDVLIPRPETELLVERAISIAKMIEQPHIMDVGTGSGIIAISLAAELPQAIVIASDLSWQALRVAQGNADRLGQAHIQFLQANLLQPLVGPFDLVCANLPYIPSHRLAALEVSKHEPRLALDGGESGLDLLRNLLAEANTRLAPTGTLLLEIESSLGSEALSLAQHSFPTAQVILHQDLAGHDRLIEIQSKETL
jgi:release factor glutamine methyltransferase